MEPWILPRLTGFTLALVLQKPRHRSHLFSSDPQVSIVDILGWNLRPQVVIVGFGVVLLRSPSRNIEPWKGDLVPPFARGTNLGVKPNTH